MYVNDVLYSEVRLFKVAISSLMDDKIWSHEAHVADEYFERKDSKGLLIIHARSHSYSTCPKYTILCTRTTFWRTPGAHIYSYDELHLMPQNFAKFLYFLEKVLMYVF